MAGAKILVLSCLHIMQCSQTRTVRGRGRASPRSQQTILSRELPHGSMFARSAMQAEIQFQTQANFYTL
jgi:hypothetical protein